MFKHLAWILLTGAAVLGTLIGVGAAELPASFIQATDPYPPLTARSYTAEMYGKNVVPPAPSHGHGAAFLFMNGETEALLKMRYTGLLSQDTGISIRGPAAPGENGSVLKSFPPGDLGVPVTFSEQEVTYLKEGRLYIVVESEKYPDGEIRGQLMPRFDPLPPY